MAVKDMQLFLNIVPVIKQIPEQSVWISYDHDADVLYVNFTATNCATDSELTDDDIIIRYDQDNIIGYTILHVSTRLVTPIMN